MAVIQWPDELPIKRMRMEISQQGVNNEGPFGSQFFKIGTPRWRCTLESEIESEETSGPYKAIVMKLKGPTNQLALHDVARPVPIGTVRGTLVAPAGVSMGDNLIYIDADVLQFGKTLVKGDLLGFGSGINQQVIMVTEDAFVDINGLLPVYFEPPARYTHGLNTPVVWDKPKVLYRNQDVNAGWDYETVIMSGIRLNLVEDTRP